MTHAGIHVITRCILATWHAGKGAMHHVLAQE